MAAQTAKNDTVLSPLVRSDDFRDQLVIAPFRNKVAAARLQHLQSFFVDDEEERLTLAIMANPPFANEEAFQWILQSSYVSVQNLEEVAELCVKLSHTIKFILPFVERAHRGAPHGFKDPRRFADMLIFMHLAIPRLSWLRGYFLDGSLESQAPEGFFAEATTNVDDVPVDPSLPTPDLGTSYSARSGDTPYDTPAAALDLVSLSVNPQPHALQPTLNPSAFGYEDRSNGEEYRGP